MYLPKVVSGDIFKKSNFASNNKFVCKLDVV